MANCLLGFEYSQKEHQRENSQHANVKNWVKSDGSTLAKNFRQVTIMSHAKQNKLLCSLEISTRDGLEDGLWISVKSTFPIRRTP